MLLGVLLVAGAGFVLLRDRAASDLQTVVVTAADDSSAARLIARALMVSLGTLQSTKTEELRVVGDTEEATAKADLILEASTATDPGVAGANLVLLAGRDRSLLWSREFKQQSGNPADLRQQIAFAAAQVLGCASEGLGADGQRLDQRTLKLYLIGCTDPTETGISETVSVIPALVAVLDRAPRFRAAWAKLLAIEAGILGTSVANGREDSKSVGLLRNLIERARKIDPEMAEIALAESVLTAPQDYAGRLSILDQALARTPGHVGLLSERSAALGSVGRMAAAVRDARYAAKVNPLSPKLWENHVAALLYAGKIDAARDVIRKAKGVWAGTAVLEDMRHRYNLRFGDPTAALRTLKSEGDNRVNELFAQARINPSRENVDRMITFMLNRLRSGERAPSGPSGLGYILQGLGQFDRNDQLFSILMGWPRPRDISITSQQMFRPALRNFVRNPRFMHIAKRAGLIDYWRTSGNWPDYCFEPDVPYDCKAEAAKLAS